MIFICITSYNIYYVKLIIKKLKSALFISESAIRVSKLLVLVLNFFVKQKSKLNCLKDQFSRFKIFLQITIFCRAVKVILSASKLFLLDN